MSSVTVNIGNLRSLVETLASKGHSDDDFIITIVDATAEIIVRDMHDMVITTLPKPIPGKNAQQFFSPKNRFK
jgi:hypothetical protein